MTLIDKVLGWLTPARRNTLYALVLGAAGLLASIGVVRPAIATLLAGFVISVLQLVVLILQSIKTKRGDMRALYLAGAAVIVGLRGLGVITDGVASHWLDVLAIALPLIPQVVGLWRTSTATPTGEPVKEYLERTEAIEDDAVAGEPLNAGALAGLEGTLAPYPNATPDPVPLTEDGRAWLLERQAEAGVAVDGVLGPQSWVVVTGSRTA